MKKLVFSIALFCGMTANAQQLLEVLKPFPNKNSEEERLENYLATGDCRLLLRTADVGLGTPDNTWFHVRLILPTGENICYMHPPLQQYMYIQDATEVVFPWLQLPYSDRAGASGTSAGKLLSGKVYQDQQFLTDDQIFEGFILVDVSVPQSDVVIETHQEANLVDGV